MQGQNFQNRRVLARPALILAVSTLVFVGAGCSNHIGTTATSFLKRVREEPDPNIRYLAYSKLASPSCYDSEEQKNEAVATLVDKLENGSEPVGTRALICHTLGELRKSAAREAIVKATSDTEPIVRVEACRALGKVGVDEDSTVLARVMTVDTMEDCRIAAIDGLRELKPKDPRIQMVLLNGMQHDDPAIRLASLKALEQITGKRFGPDAIVWQKGLNLEVPTLIASPGSPSNFDPNVRTAGNVEPPPVEEPAYPPKLAPLKAKYGIGKAQYP